MALYESHIKSLPRLGKGKVRDIYAVGADKMLIVTSDRLSAFDVVLSDPIPDKGRVLNEMANFWFERLGHIVPNQLTGIDPESVVAEDEKGQVRGRSIVVQKLKPLPIEAVVRGYIIGSGWKDYQKTGKICGIELPKGLMQAEKLPEPNCTPGTRAGGCHGATSRVRSCMPTAKHAPRVPMIAIATSRMPISSVREALSAM
jgi:phosphoribosylaminoimidazole-succinocarboxamide synthase